jgi:NAD(P)-dependent dehydrogenase (short-subunit alcohol dehydrogenase family)
MIDINIKGVLYGIAAALPYMKAQKSRHFINVSSVAGHKIGPAGVVYSATKHAVRVISEGLRQEVKPYNTRTTIISPGGGRDRATQQHHGRQHFASDPRFLQEICDPRRQLRPLRAFRHEPAGGRGRERDPLQAYVAGIVTAAFARARPAYHPRPRFPRSTGGFGDRSRRKSLMRHQ